MALTKKNVSNAAGFRGTPTSDTDFEQLDFGFVANNIKVIVCAGSTAGLALSWDGKDTFIELPAPETSQNPMVYDLAWANLSRIFVRNTGAQVEILACGAK